MHTDTTHMHEYMHAHKLTHTMYTNNPFTFIHTQRSHEHTRAHTYMYTYDIKTSREALGRGEETAEGKEETEACRRQ